jgi:hypothetical protein
VAPGNSIGTLTTQSVVLTAASAKLNVEIDVDATPAADMLDVFGTIDLGGGTLDLDLLNAPPVLAAPMTFLIVRNDSTDAVTGSFSAITGLLAGYGAMVDYAYSGTDARGLSGTGNDIAVTLSAVPEARAWLMVSGAAIVAIGAAMARRRVASSPPQ